MQPRLLVLLAAVIVFTPGLALAQLDLQFQRDNVGAKTDPTSRDNAYVSASTTAQERAIDTAQHTKTEVHRPKAEHQVIYRESHGVMVPHDVYLIPPGPEEQEETGQIQ